MNYKQQLVVEVAKRCTACGYVVYVSGSLEYAFYTDAHGSRVVEFGFDDFALRFTGAYRAVHKADERLIARGWRIKNDVELAQVDRAFLNYCFNATPPEWATHGRPVRRTTRDEVLKDYRNTSQYSQFVSVGAKHEADHGN